jgi:hypothetical protein
MTKQITGRKDSSKYSSKSIWRKTVGLTIRHDLLALAREHSVNLSKLLELCLIQLLQAQNKPFSLGTGSLFSKKEKVWWAGPDLDRRPSARQADVLPC